MVSKMIPEEYRKVLKNIRKVEERKKRFTEDNESDGQTHITSKSKTYLFLYFVMKLINIFN